jgi:iron complex outermembrane receptor protein
MEYRVGFARGNLRALLLMTSICCGVELFSAAKAVAAETEAASAATTIETITVTARRRTERLVDVPVAITALSTTDLAHYSVTDVTDVNTLVPELSLRRSPSGAGANLTIRGVGSSAPDAGVEQQVSFNLDGVATSRGRIIELGLLDVENLQVLKGPQALFFGKNSPGGVVSVTSVSPGRSYSGYGLVSYGDADQAFRAETAVSLPINDTLSIRLAFRATTSRGYMVNTAMPEIDPFTFAPFVTGHPPVMTRPATRLSPGDRGELGRFTAVWRPTGQFDATFKFAGGYDRNNGPNSSGEIVACGPGETHPVVLGVPDVTNDCKPNWHRSSSQLPAGIGIPLDPTGATFETTETYLSSLTLNYHLDKITISSITGYLHYADHAADDFDYSNLAALFGASTENNTSWSQEIRAVSAFAGPLNFTAGAYYENTSRRFDQDIKLLQLFPDPITGRWDNANSVDYTNDFTYSAFGQLNWKILANLELAGGARYTHELKLGSVGNDYVNPVPSPATPHPLPVVDRVHARVAADNVSPEATLTWHPRANTTLYGAYKTGFLSGGISNPGNLTAGSTAASLSFQPETVHGGELGAKGYLFGNRVSLDVTAYLYDYKNLQVTSFDSTTFAYTTKNAATARVQGVELQGSYQVMEGLKLHGYLAYNDASYTSFPAGQCFNAQTVAQGCVAGVQNLTGTSIAANPTWSGNVGVSYDRHILDELMIGLSLDTYLTSDFNYTASTTFHAGEMQAAMARFDASIRLYRGERTGWELALIARNLTDRKYITYGTDSPGGGAGVVAGFVAPPRDIIVQASYRF